MDDSNDGTNDDDEDDDENGESINRGNNICEVGLFENARAYLLCMLDHHPSAAAAVPLMRDHTRLMRLFIKRLPADVLCEHESDDDDDDDNNNNDDNDDLHR